MERKDGDICGKKAKQKEIVAESLYTFGKNLFFASLLLVFKN